MLPGKDSDTNREYTAISIKNHGDPGEKIPLRGSGFKTAINASDIRHIIAGIQTRQSANKEGIMGEIRKKEGIYDQTE